MPAIFLKQKPNLISNIDIYGYTHSLVIRGDYMNPIINKIPTKTGTPYTYSWSQKTLTGTTIQSASGTLATNLTTDITLDIPLGLTAFPIAPDEFFTFQFQIEDGLTVQDIINVRFKVASDSTNPTSPDILLLGINQRNALFEPLTAIEATAFNNAGTGLDLGYIIDLTRPVLWTINGQEQPQSELEYVAVNKVKIASLLTEVSEGDRLRIIYYNA